MADFDNLSSGSTTAKRPTIITVLGILSFIGAGFAIIGGIMTLLMSNVDGSGSMRGTAAMMAVLSPAAWVTILIMLLAVGRIIGVLQMFKMNKSGFMIYAVSDIGHVILTIIGVMQIQAKWAILTEGMGGFAVLAGGPGYSGGWLSVVVAVILCGVFVGGYASQSKNMK